MKNENQLKTFSIKLCIETYNLYHRNNYLSYCFKIIIIIRTNISYNLHYRVIQKFVYNLSII